MTCTQFNFSVKNITGSAVIVDSVVDVKKVAETAFKNDGDNRRVCINLIGRCDGPDQPGYNAVYHIYEAYTDSGGSDYYYFGVMAESYVTEQY